jgi:hypothetical protein
VAYRASYGADFYGSGLYGVTGAIDAAATVTPALSAVCSAQVVKDGAAAIASTLSVSVVDPDTVNDASATITLQSATVSVGEEYVEADGYRPGYGLRTYGTSIYGRNDSVEQGTATIAITSTMTVGVNPQFNAQATIASTLTTTASGVFDVVGAVNLAVSLSLSTSVARVLLGSSTSTVALSLATTAIEKWEPVAGTPETWTPVAASNETWTPITDSRAA